jgi:hypothetical protein
MPNEQGVFKTMAHHSKRQPTKGKPQEGHLLLNI